MKQCLGDVGGAYFSGKAGMNLKETIWPVFQWRLEDLEFPRECGEGM